MDPSQSNDGSQGGVPGGNNYPYMYGYQVPPWTHPQAYQVPPWSHPQGFQQFQPTVPQMHPTGNGAQGVLPPAEMGDASLQNDVAEVEEVEPQGCRVQGRKKKAGVRIKLGNFNPNEDVLLVKSYAEIGDDPITNTGQKKERFWERITDRYNLLRGDYPERSLRSLGSRFDVISKEVSKFASYHAAVMRENPSGMTDADKTTHAATNFAAVEKRNFAYLHYWEIMKHLPKWQDAPSAAVGEGFGEDTINLEDENESAGKRPMGRDSAKAAKKKANSSAGSSSSSEYASRMQELSLQRNSIIQEESVRKNERFQQLACIDEKRFEEMRSHNQALIEVAQEKVRIMREKHDMEREKEEKQEAERILQIDLDNCTPAQRVYYEEQQAEILEKIAIRRRKRQGHA